MHHIWSIDIAGRYACLSIHVYHVDDSLFFCRMIRVNLPCPSRRSQRTQCVQFRWVFHFDRRVPRWNGRSYSCVDYSVAASRSAPKPHQSLSRGSCETRRVRSESVEHVCTYQLGSTSMAGHDALSGSSLRPPKLDGAPRDCIKGSRNENDPGVSQENVENALLVYYLWDDRVSACDEQQQQ